LERSGPLLKPGGQILVFTRNERTEDGRGFAASVAYHASRFSNPLLWVTKIQFIGGSRLRWGLQQLTSRLARAAARRPLLYLPILPIAGGCLAVASYLCSRAAARIASEEPPRRGFVSSVFMIIPRPEIPVEISLPSFEQSRPSSRIPIGHAPALPDRIAAGPSLAARQHARSGFVDPLLPSELGSEPWP
jgi:hypothetical protein